MRNPGLGMTKINRGSYVLTSRSGHFQVIIIFYIIKKGRLGDRLSVDMITKALTQCKCWIN